MTERLHAAQATILDILRHTEEARFSALMRPTGMTSDTFKFHLQKVVKLGYVYKTAAGGYQLTAAGKEFANNIDDQELQRQKQPKLSVLLIVSKTNQDGERLYLFQKRLRNPFYGRWGLLSGPVRWGESIEETAVRELHKQTRLTAACTVRSFYRQRDFDKASRQRLEDKLFAIVEATDLQAELQNNWPGGHNEWMTMAEYERLPLHFASDQYALAAVRNNRSYISQDISYDSKDY